MASVSPPIVRSFLRHRIFDPNLLKLVSEYDPDWTKLQDFTRDFIRVGDVPDWFGLRFFIAQGKLSKGFYFGCDQLPMRLIPLPWQLTYQRGVEIKLRRAKMPGHFSRYSNPDRCTYIVFDKMEPTSDVKLRFAALKLLYRKGSLYVSAGSASDDFKRAYWFRLCRFWPCGTHLFASENLRGKDGYIHIMRATDPDSTESNKILDWLHDVFKCQGIEFPS